MLFARSDNQLQDLINKIVPGFAKSERAARTQFYASRGEPEESELLNFLNIFHHVTKLIHETLRLFPLFILVEEYLNFEYLYRLVI